MEEPIVEQNMTEFVSSAIGAVTKEVDLAQIAAVVALIIGGGILAIFAWKFARKGYKFVTNALSGKSGKF